MHSLSNYINELNRFSGATNYWFIFLIFAILPLYYSLRKPWQNIFLIVASYVFYGFWDYRFLSLVIITTLLNYFFSSKIHRANDHATKKIILIISLIYNLGILGFFKYYNFFITSFIAAFQSFGFIPHVKILNIILPLGISFFTFKIMGYLVDIYKNKQTPSNLASFALFVSYFPEISAGPIGRAHKFLPQIERRRLIAKEQMFAGAQLILLGLFKKKMIADAIAPYVDQLYSSPQGFMSVALLCGMYLYALQIYADFSGYTDIVRGISKLLGIEIMENFKQPYLSRGISEFWRRWHISLSSWLKDYLYIPLGGNRRGDIRTYINLLITMLLCGLWHGASWTFVIWGGIHGIYLTINRYIKDSLNKRGPTEQANYSNVRLIILILITFHMTSFAWIFFRAPDLATATSYIFSLFNNISPINHASTLLIILTLFYTALVLMIDYPSYRADRELLVTSETPWLWRGVVYALLILSITFIGGSYVKPFIYFNF